MLASTETQRTRKGVVTVFVLRGKKNATDTGHKALLPLSLRPLDVPGIPVG